MLICTTYADGPLVGGVGVTRKPGKYFGEPEVELFNHLYPHLRSAMQLHRELQREAQLGRAALATLNRIHSAAFICDEGGEVLHANAHARALLADVRVGRPLPLGSPADSVRLRRAIGIAARAAGSGTPGDNCVRLTSSFDVPAVAIVSSLYQHDVVQFLRPMVAVIINHAAVDPERSGTLAETYGLTRAEARLAAALLDGKRVRGMPRGTCRSLTKRRVPI